ncbi:hypothetical protein TanjilG_28150 [Lupinus angustifolius]|uniref:Exostosin GT47 domain-containing protein n=1 Tax=Lupinus angustifolius TaxID=3871 RepID=A0A1J7G194_LUPAN|nr:hypothetical protein TanjilG_28150 [Lupinus angustifolius]
MDEGGGAKKAKARKPKPTFLTNSHALFHATIRKPFLKQFLPILFLIIALYALFNAFLNPTLHATTTATAKNHAVKVYLYDLPTRFTYGIIHHHSLARGASRDAGDLSSLKYPGHQHMSEWYLFSDLSRPESERVGSPIVRVSDPDEADLFFVPFFSSLSLIVNPVRAPGSVQEKAPVYSDEKNQEALVEWLKGQEYWKRNNGRDHVIVASDPNAMYRVIDHVKNSVLLVSDFGRVRPDQGSLVKDVVVPYSHRIRSYQGDVSVDKRGTLLFFMGNRYRKEGGKVRDTLFQILENEKDVVVKHGAQSRIRSYQGDVSVDKRGTLLFFMGNRYRKEGGKVRDTLFQILENEKDVVVKHGAQSRESRRAASQGMHTSKFCLHPAGDTPSACRLFDAIVSLCIPVIVSDSIELPFEDTIDYRKISVFVETASAIKPGYLVSKLRAVTPDRILEYQKELKEVKRYFEYDEQDGTVNEIWRQVSKKLPLIKLMINRDKRLVRKEPDCSCICVNQTTLR